MHLAAGWLRPGLPGRKEVAEVLVLHYRVYAALLCALVLYFALRFSVAGPDLGLAGAVSPAQHIETFGQHALVAVASLSQHIWSAIWPFQDISPARHLAIPIETARLWPMTIASVSAILVALVAAFRGGPARIPALLFFAFVASLLPVANIVPLPVVVFPQEVSIASRYLTFPLIFASLAVPFIVRQTETLLVKHGRAFRVLLWVVICAWLLASIANIRVTTPLWKDDGTLSSWIMKQGGVSSWRYAGIGSYYLRIGDYSHAREAFTASVKLRDDELAAWIWSDLGVAEAALGHYARAIQAFRRALELGTSEMPTRLNIARLERATGNPRAAADVIEEGLRRISLSGRPDELEARLLQELGLAYSDLGRTVDAVSRLNAALKLARNFQERKDIQESLRSVAPKQR